MKRLIVLNWILNVIVFLWILLFIPLYVFWENARVASSLEDLALMFGVLVILILSHAAQVVLNELEKRRLQDSKADDFIRMLQYVDKTDPLAIVSLILRRGKGLILSESKRDVLFYLVTRGNTPDIDCFVDFQKLDQSILQLQQGERAIYVTLRQLSEHGSLTDEILQDLKQLESLILECRIEELNI